jgi:hypothetical protein
LARPARALPTLPNVPPALPTMDEEGVLDEVLHALALDLRERGGLVLSECFVDATFVGAKKGRVSGKDQAGQGGVGSLWC